MCPLCFVRITEKLETHRDPAMVVFHGGWEIPRATVRGQP